MRIITRKGLGDAMEVAGDMTINRCILKNGLWMLYCE